MLNAVQRARAACRACCGMCSTSGWEASRPPPSGQPQPHSQRTGAGVAPLQLGLGYPAGGMQTGGPKIKQVGTCAKPSWHAWHLVLEGWQSKVRRQVRGLT